MTEFVFRQFIGRRTGPDASFVFGISFQSNISEDDGFLSRIILELVAGRCEVVLLFHVLGFVDFKIFEPSSSPVIIFSLLLLAH